LADAYDLPRRQQELSISVEAFDPIHQKLNRMLPVAPLVV
jgi:hypothetical protein